MPIVKLKHIVSFSSEDKIHKADNLLKGNTDGKWRCEKPGEKQVSVVIQLEKAVTISSIDIGNDGSAFIEVLVSRSTGDETYRVLLVASSFMSPTESRSGSGANRVRMFALDKLNQTVTQEKWDRIKVVCTQPFNKHSSYGLSFINLHTNEASESSESSASSKSILDSKERDLNEGRKTFGAFKLKQVEKTDVPSVKPLMKPSTVHVAQIKPIKKHKSVPDEDAPKEKKPKVASSATKLNSVSKAKEQPSLKLQRQSNGAERSDTSSKGHHKAAKKSSKQINQILRNVTFVLSGYQNPQRSHLRDRALMMGAQYKKDWGPGCTHLVCAFRNTPKFLQAMGTDGHIVRSSWIDDCYSMKRRLPHTKYSIKPDDSSTSGSEEECESDAENSGAAAISASVFDESTDEQSPDTEEEIERIHKKNTDDENTRKLSSAATDEDPYNASTDEEVENETSSGSSDLPPLPNHFSGRHFFLHGQFQPGVERMLKRHIITCDGTIVNYMSDDVNYVITESPWQDEFDDVIADNTSVVFIRPSWVFKCGQVKQLVPYSPYSVPTN